LLLLFKNNICLGFTLLKLLSIQLLLYFLWTCNSKIV
jgi:hypothetical protein